MTTADQSEDKTRSSALDRAGDWVRNFYSGLSPKARLAYGGGVTAALIVVIVLIVVLTSGGGSDDGDGSVEPTSTQPSAGATPTPSATQSPATSTPTPGSTPAPGSTPTPIPNIVEGLRLSSDTDTGRSDIDGITSARAPKLLIDAENAASVEVLLNGQVFESLDGGDQIEFTFPDELAEGVFGVEIRLLNGSGAEQELLGPLFVTIDVTSPAAPELLSLSPESDVGISQNDDLTSIANPIIQGASGPGDSIRIMSGGNVVGTAISPTDGNWQVLLDELGEGSHIVTAVSEDAAGNPGEESLPYEFTIDLTPPQISVSEPANGATLTGSATLSGTFSDAESGVIGGDYRIGSGSLIPLFTSPGSGSFNSPIVLDESRNGNQELVVSAIDASGNVAFEVRSVFVDVVDPFVITETRPSDGEGDIGVTVKPEIFFSEAVDPATLTSQSLNMSAGGETLSTNIVPSDDGMFVWVFPSEPVPGSSTVSVSINGDLIRPAAGGTTLDADGDGSPGGTLSFSYSSVSLQASFGTTLSGVIADPGLDGKPMTADDLDPGADGTIGTADDVALLPIQGVEISLLGLENSITTTGADGSYLLDSVPTGIVKVKIDGLTGTSPTGFYFPEMVMHTEIRAGENNDIMPGHRIAFLPRLPNEILQTVSASEKTMIVGDAISAPDLPSEQRSLLSIEIQPNSLVAPDGSRIDSAEIGISTVPPELVMDMLPAGVLQHTFDITIQALGVANFSVPAPMTFPNVFDEPPGTQLNFLSFNHDTGLLEIEGTATVSEDGASVTTDPGTGIVRAGWHGLTRPGSITLPGCNPEKAPTVEVDPNAFISREHFVKVNADLKRLVEEFPNSFKPQQELKDKWVPGPIDDEFWTSDEVFNFRSNAEYRIRVENRDESGKAELKDSSKSCENLKQTPLVVEVVIIGPASEFMHISAGGKAAPALFDPVGSAARKFKSQILQDDEPSANNAGQIFGFLVPPGEAKLVHFNPFKFIAPSPGAKDSSFIDFNEETIFGAEVQIRAFKWQEPENLLIDEKFFLGNWADVSDSSSQDGFASMPDATVDGKGAGLTRRKVTMRMPNPLTFESNNDAFRFETGEFSGFIFDPLEIGDSQRAKMKVTGPEGQDLGTIPVGGDGIIVDVWINDEGFLKALEDAFARITFTDLRDEGLKNQIDTPDKRAQIFRDTLAEILVRLDPLITAGEDGQKGTRDDGGIRFANAQVPGKTLDIIEWIGPVAPFPQEIDSGKIILGNATTVDWDKPFTPINLTNSALNRWSGAIPLSTQREAFRLVESVNINDDGQIRIFIDRWLLTIDRNLIQRGIDENQKPPEDRKPYPDPRQALIEGLASTMAHEIGHTVGLAHTSTNFNPRNIVEDALTKEILVRGAKQDIMAQGADFRGELTYPLTEGMYKLAIGQFWDAQDRVNARKYWVHYVRAMARFNRRDGLPPNTPFNIDGGGEDGDVPVIDFIGAGLPALIVDPDTDPDVVDEIDFGIVPTGQGSIDRIVGLFNIGDRPMTVENVAIEPGSSPKFSVNSVPSGTVVQPGDFAELIVTFAPNEGGTASGRLLIETEVGGGGLVLSGFGQRQERDISVDVVENNLGGVQVTGNSAPKIAGRIGNIGTETLTITSVEIAGDDSVFSIGQLSLPATLAAGETLEISASFAPAATGLQRESILITSNDPDTPEVVLRLSGTGTAEFPGILVEYGNDFIAIETPASDLSPVLRDRTDSAGNFEFFLPPETLATFVTFDPVSGLVSSGGMTTSPAGEDTVMPTVPFRASATPDFDNDGLPADIEFAIGSSDSNPDSDGDGIDDFTAVQLGLNPLGALAIPTGIVSQLALAGDAEAVAIGSSTANPDAIIAYVATGQAGFASVDITDPLQPVILSELNLLGDSTDLAVDLGNGRVFVAAGSAGIHVIDVSNPALPRVVQNISTPGPPRRLVLNERGLFAASNNELLAIDPTLGVVVSQLTATGAVLEAIAAEGDHVFVNDQNGQFAAVNVSTALLDGKMTLISMVSAHRVERLTVLDGVAYLAAEGSFTTCDVSDPANITVISDTANGEPNNFGVELVPGGDGIGALMYALFDREPTVLVMDISDPAQTGRLLTRFDLPANPQDATFAAGQVVIADGSGGLVIVNYQPIDVDGVAPSGILSLASADGDPEAPGAQLTEGSVAAMRIEASDDVQVRTAELLRNGIVVQSDASFPFELFATLPALAQTDSVTFQARVTDTGGSSSLTNSVEILLLPDVEGPRLISIDPNDRGFAASGEVQVEALFSEALAADTVTAANIHLSGPGGTVTPSDIATLDGDRRVRLTFDSLNAGLHTLTVESSRVTDVGGTPAGDVPITSTFEVIDATNSWINPAGGDWSEAGNWSAGRVPDSTDVVVISLPGSVTVQFFGAQVDAVAAQLYVDDRLEILRSGVTLQEHGVISGTAVFATSSTLISEGTFEVRGTLIAGGGFRFRTTNFENTGTILGPEGGVGIGGGDFDNHGLVRARGFTLGQNPGFRLGGEGPITFTNFEDGVVEIIDGGQFNGFTSDSDIKNFGTIRSDGGDGMFGKILNEGLIEVVSGEFRFGVFDFVSDGGTFRIAAGAEMNMSGEIMEVRGDTVFEGDGLVNDDATIDVVDGATLTLNMAGGFVFSQNKTFTGAGTLTNIGLFIWETGTIDLDTAFINRGTFEIFGVPTVPVNLDGDLDNFGSILYKDTTPLDIDTATLHNMPGAIFDFQSDGDIDSGNNDNTHFFINDGTLIKTGGTGISDLDIVLTNSQSIDVQTGAIRVRRQTSFTNTAVTVAAGAEFRISSGDHSFNGTFSVSGDGTVLIGNVNTTYNVPAGTNIMLGTTGGIRLLNGTWVGDGSLTLLESSTYSRGTFELGGGVVNSAGKLMRLTSSGNKTLRNTTLTNHGTFSNEATALLELADTTIVTTAGGVFELRGSGGIRVIGSGGSSITNFGTFTKFNLGASTYRFEVPFINEGLVELLSHRTDFTRGYTQNSGTTSLNGGSLYVGNGETVELNGGVLSGRGTITGNVINGGRLNVGGDNATGTLTITGDYTQLSIGTLTIEIEGVAAGEFDLLKVGTSGTKAVTLDGTVEIELINGFSPVLDDSFVVINHGSPTGAFSSTNVPGLGGGLSIDLVVGSGDTTATVIN